ncbi:hypothetical protein [uncultured Polaribacter sp.]|uniref:OB-fold protein n=1 Tax=uncultured Polaribacter sp. TaxID=174711 RepID=UPI0026021A20|nr:hypothetical protein [uncultured Polaribacter sp.]
MSKNKIIITLTILILAIVTVAVFVMPYFKDTNTNIKNVTSDVKLNSKDLVNAYLVNEKESNTTYTGKVIEISGKVKSVSFLNNRNTVILYGLQENYGVICDVHQSQVAKLKLLKINQKIMVKGICKGFLKDVILLNCYIETQINE